MLNTERVMQLKNNGDRHDDSKCLERVKNIALLVSKLFHSLNVSNHCNIPSNHRNRMAKGKPHVIIVVENTNLQIARIPLTRPKLRRPRRSAQLVGVVMESIVETAVDVVADAKLIAINGSTIRWMRVEMIM